MAEPSVIHSTLVIERSYPTTPERVFVSFADPAKKRLWFTDCKSSTIEFMMDFRVGGVDRVCFRLEDRTPFPGTAIVNHTTYQNIVPNRRIVMATR